MSAPARQLLTTLSTLRTGRMAARVPMRWLRVWRAIVANPAARTHRSGWRSARA